MPNLTLQAVLALLPMFFHNNPTVEEIEALLPQIITAISSAKAGQAFSVTGVPLPVDNVKGAFNFGWSPNAAA